MGRRRLYLQTVMLLLRAEAIVDYLTKNYGTGS
jgi:hypothetical protein